MSGYKGIAFPFRFGGNGGVATSTTSMDDFSHINESIEQIILTKLGERIIEIDFGSEAHKQLFSQMDDEVELSILKFYITESLQLWEPRIEVVDVVLEPLINDNDESYIQCTIYYKVTKYMTNGSTTFKLSAVA